MNILFIGGTGSISAACSDEVVARGHDLWLLNRGSRNQRAPGRANLFTADIDKLDTATLSFIRSREWDVVVNWVVFNRAQALRDIEIFGGHVRHYVFISTTAVYAETPPDHRIVEVDNAGDDTWSYTTDKVVCEGLFREAHEDRGFPVTVVRAGHTYADFTVPTNIAGLGFGLFERMRSGKPVILHDRGESVWTLTYNREFAKGLIGLFGIPETFGEIYHITSDEHHTWRDILDMYAQVLDVTPNYVSIPTSALVTLDPMLGLPLQGDRSKNRLFSNDKIKNITADYSDNLDLRSGITRLIDWHQAHPDQIRVDVDVAEDVDRIVKTLSAL